MLIGVDIGGSLTKIVAIRNGVRDFKLLEHTNAAEVASDIQAIIESGQSRWPGGNGKPVPIDTSSRNRTAASENSSSNRTSGGDGNISGESVHISATGCGARELAKYLDGPVKITDELESTCAGARQLAVEQRICDDPFVLTSLGTGTSVFHITPTSGARSAGTGIGGGTITGLGSLLLATRDFSKILNLASKGERRNVDLMVGDLYPDTAESPVLSVLTAANFGKANADRRRKQAICGDKEGREGDKPSDGYGGNACTRPEEPTDADVASAIVQMVVESVGVLSIQVARTHKSRIVVVAGSPSGHPLIRERFLEIGEHLGHEFGFLRNGAFCGALGTIL